MCKQVPVNIEASTSMWLVIVKCAGSLEMIILQGYLVHMYTIHEATPDK